MQGKFIDHSLNMKNEKLTYAAPVYFRNLNGFRFLAAASVVITHIELFKNRIGIQNSWKHPLIFQLGSAGVDFFFVLSGFLISYLLLTEHKQEGRIDLPKFYVRRILRIWPLYYFILILAFFIIPNISFFYIEGYSNELFQGFWQKLTAYLLISPNVGLSIFGNVPYASPAWSIGVEEQFYLIWPAVLLFSQNRMKAILIFIVVFIALKFGMIVLHRTDILSESSYVKVKDLVVSTRMECMGIGGLGAVLIFTKHKLLKLLQNRLELVLIPVAFLLIYFSDYLFEFHHILLSLVFLLIILHAVYLEHTIVNLERSIFNYLGKISYGIYMYHTILITVSYKIVSKITGPGYSVGLNILLYIVSFTLSIFIAALSYRYFESIFLKKKIKYSNIISGEEARLIN